MPTTANASVPRSRPMMGCAYVIMAIVLAAGVGLLLLAQRNYRQFGEQVSAAMLAPLLVGLVLLFATAGIYRLAKKALREHDEEEARRAQFPGQPWKWKKEWAGPALEAKAGTGAAVFWVFTICWNAIAFPAAWVVLHAPHREKAALFVLLFPVVGMLILAGAIYHTMRWRKYGRVRFVPSSLPGVIGGYLGGMIEVPARVVPEGEARLKLKCVRRETRRSGKNRTVTDVLLWEHEELIAREKWMTGLGGTQIPVLFYIPATGVATDDSDRDNEIVWKLTADAATPGVDFATQFEVPVFATGEIALPPEAGKPLLAEYSARPLDDVALKACGVRREGNTFHFGASHLPGTKVTTAVLFFGLIGLLVWFTLHGAHGVVWMVTLFFGLIMSLFFFGVWCSHYELRIEGPDVIVTKPRPWGTKVMRLRREEVRLIKTDKSMASGDNQYYQLSLVGAEGIDPKLPAQDGEPFRARKLRYQFAQLEKPGQLTPEKVKALGGEIIAEFRLQPKFIVPFAKHIPGQTKAEAVGEMVLKAIRGM